MKKKLYCAFIELSSNRLQSFLLKRFTESRLSKLVVKSFVKLFNINESEMEKPLHEYSSLQSLFTRKLKAGVRKIDPELTALVSPVDGIFSDRGSISKECSFFVKGQNYELTDMLGSVEIAKKYEGGTYAIFYLSPSHYHRIHSPISGQIVQQFELGSISYPVNKWGLLYGKKPLSKNFRKITEISCRNYCMSIVKVGAFNVNSIQITHSDPFVQKGEEIGYFSFGSTVILLFEKGMVELQEKQTYPLDVNVGEAIGKLNIVRNDSDALLQ